MDRYHKKTVRIFLWFSSTRFCKSLRKVMAHHSRSLHTFWCVFCACCGMCETKNRLDVKIGGFWFNTVSKYCWNRSNVLPKREKEVCFLHQIHPTLVYPHTVALTNMDGYHSTLHLFGAHWIRPLLFSIRRIKSSHSAVWLTLEMWGLCRRFSSTHWFLFLSSAAACWEYTCHVSEASCVHLPQVWKDQI